MVIISGFKHWQALLKDKQTAEWISNCLTSGADPWLTSKDCWDMKMLFKPKTQSKLRPLVSINLESILKMGFFFKKRIPVQTHEVRHQPPCCPVSWHMGRRSCQRICEMFEQEKKVSESSRGQLTRQTQKSNITTEKDRFLWLNHR